jgi:glucose/arabinose dehydrogenase
MLLFNKEIKRVIYPLPAYVRWRTIIFKFKFWSSLKNALARAALLCSLSLILNQSFGQNEPFTMRVVNPSYQLNSAWELTWGPDDSLWVTENAAYKVDRIHPGNGGKTLLVDLSSLKDFTSPPKWPQGGLMGMALHPSMYSEWPNPSRPWIYLAYVYHYVPTAGCSGGSGPCYFNTKIVRYNYNRATHTLSNQQTIISTLNGSNDHNSGRFYCVGW